MMTAAELDALLLAGTLAYFEQEARREMLEEQKQTGYILPYTDSKELSECQ